MDPLDSKSSKSALSPTLPATLPPITKTGKISNCEKFILNKSHQKPNDDNSYLNLEMASLLCHFFSGWTLSRRFEVLN